MYFDSHAHYYDAKLMDEFGEGVDKLIDSLKKDNKVSYVINVGTNIENSKIALEQARNFDIMYVGAGIHPSDCKEISDMQKALFDLEALITSNRDKIVALGEIGLDYHWEPIEKSRQKEYFYSQLDLAEKLSIPVIIHDREAHGDCFDAVADRKNMVGVFHSYSGSYEMAKDLINRGWYISFSGTLTFKNAERVREVAKKLPHDRVLIETDAPYLAPHPHRGKVNHSGYLEFTNQTLAEVWGIEKEEAAKITENNAKLLFGIH